MKISLIFSTDFDIQVLRVVFGNLDAAWDIANAMYTTGHFTRIGVQDYDVVAFDNIAEMNEWLESEVETGRKSLHREWVGKLSTLSCN